MTPVRTADPTPASTVEPSLTNGDHRPPSAFDQADWLMRHTALLNEQKAQWTSDRRTVYVEGQNAFRLRGKSATLAGWPDLVVADDRDAIIIDVKTGREQPWHKIRVMIYQYALPLALPRYRNVQIGGGVIYPTHTVRILWGGPARPSSSRVSGS